MKPHRFLEQLDVIETAPLYGFVEELGAGLVRASGPVSRLGQLCEIALGDGSQISAEVVAVGDRGVTLIPLEQEVSLSLGARVTAAAHHGGMTVGDAFAGRAADALGRPIDSVGPLLGVVPDVGTDVSALERINPDRIMPTGLRAIDGLLTLGVGQRIGIFAASGVGKTSLVEQLAAQIDCDRCILCLVGERGREVSGLWEMVQTSAKPERFSLVAATSDESPVMRARAVEQALSMAEHWRAQGEHVLLIIDSITRLAMALREIGLAAGAPPTVRAYTPNVFATLPAIVERCGVLLGKGAITAIMTVLSETDDVDDPIVEVMKSLLDGHIVLSRRLADQGQFPAIDIVRSVSRQAARLVDPDHLAMMRRANALLATYDENRVMIESGVYRSRSNEQLDAAIAARPALAAFLRQSTTDAVEMASTLIALRTVIA